MIGAFPDISVVTAGFYNAQESLDNPPPFLMEQVHGADALILDEIPTQPLLCDALVTHKQALQLTIKTADCAPVLFVDPNTHIIGAAHAGWKGTFQGILENTILTMLSLGAKLENIYAAIGPHLMQQSFQISPSMYALFPKTEQLYFKETETGIYFDFTGYLQHRLTRSGIQKINTIRLDTYSNSAYNSYRREAKNPARQYSFVTLK